MQSTSQNAPGSAGFSLLEIVVAMLIGAILVLGVGTATVSSHRSVMISEQRSQATALAQDVLECLRDQYVAGVTLNGACNPTAVPAGFTVAAPTITPNPGGFPSGVTLHSVTVTWAGNTTGSITLQSLLNN